MSLTAYDGMMTKKSFKYIQEETIKRIDSFKEASINKLVNNLSIDIVNHFDGNDNIVDNIEFDAINDSDLLEKIKKIDTTNISVLSFLKQSGRILSKSQYQNMFTLHLNLTIEFLNKKFLIYPNILVPEHRNILLEYLDDWYCQNQSDPDENVSSSEWEEREKDWYAFNENRYYKNTIKLFDPNYFISNIVKYMDNDFLTKVINKIPNEDERLFYKAKKIIIESELKNIDDENKISYFMKRDKELKSDKKIVYDYIKKNNMILIKINKELLTKKMNLNEK
jgi:hypothetical protein